MTITSAFHEGPRLDGRCGIVTGAASGIGAATVRKLVSCGAAVTAFDVDADGLEKLWSGESGVSTMAVDVADSHAVNKAVSQAVEAMGRLDFFAHAAGVDADRNIKIRVSEHYPSSRWDRTPGLAATADLSDEEWQRLLRINLDGRSTACELRSPT